MATGNYYLRLRTFVVLYFCYQGISTDTTTNSNVSSMSDTSGISTDTTTNSNVSSMSDTSGISTDTTNSYVSSISDTSGISTGTTNSGVSSTTGSKCSNPRSDASLNWHYYDGNCYSFYTDANFTYNEAKEFCKRNGAALTSVHSIQEMVSIGLMTGGQGRNFWIGLRKDISGVTKWEDGSPLDFIYWRSDFVELSRGSGEMSYGFCAYFNSPRLIWEWDMCDEKKFFTCKFSEDADLSVGTTPTVHTLTGNCPDGWYTFEDNCYKIFGKQFRERKKWDDASRHCRTINSTLASIHSAKEQGFLNVKVHELRSRLWIGLRRGSSWDPFNWDDGSNLDYANWMEGEPNNHLDAEENCVQMLESHGFIIAQKLGKWNDAPCNFEFPYICQMSKNPMISEPGIDPSHCIHPKGWIKSGTSCYKVFRVDENPGSWLEAQFQCQRHNSSLATVKSEQVTDDLKEEMADLEGYFWIGINTTADQRYKWIGEKPIIYSNWQKNQPKVVSEEDNCVAVDTDGEWMVRNCNESLPFICEVNEAGSEPPTLPPHHSNMTCPRSSTMWHDFGGTFCYIIEVKERRKWYEALCQCKKAGGSLASFHSKGEVNVMSYHLKDLDLPLHIGLQRDIRGRFVWSDGSPTDFSYWSTGQPSSGVEQCSSMYSKSGKWSDIQCGEMHGYICSARKVPRDVPPPPPETRTSSDGHHMSAVVITLITISTLVLFAMLVAAWVFVYPKIKTKLPDKDKVPFAHGED